MEADWFERLREYCGARPGAWEDHPWGETVYKWKKKVFAFLGPRDAPSVTVRPTENREALLSLPFVRVAPYVGRYGWVTVEIADEAAWELARELVDQSYRRLAGSGGGRAGAREQQDDPELVSGQE
ncbi:MAG: MmcQ/YjbR family DNA-binding protein [Armatimonadetes bacterium]|nr:MmcQ/YjbR family DNA-binding protein [Armatimonadota bacterium]